MSTSFCRTALLALIASTVLLFSTAWDARAGGCKPNGQACSTDISCCSRDCAKPIAKKSSRPAMFGLCCPAGSNLLCGGTKCVNTQTDSNNCGGCGNVCSTGQVCTGGACCTPASCSGACGLISDGCGGTIGCECDGRLCLTCESGTCVSTCQSGEMCLGGTCVTPTTTTTSTTTSTTTTTMGLCTCTCSAPSGTVCAFFCDATMSISDCADTCAQDCNVFCLTRISIFQCPAGTTTTPGCAESCESTTTTTTASTTTTTLPCAGGCTPSCSAGTFCVAQSSAGEVVACGCVPGNTCTTEGLCLAFPVDGALPCSDGTNPCPPQYMCGPIGCVKPGFCDSNCSCLSPGYCELFPS